MPTARNVNRISVRMNVAMGSSVTVVNYEVRHALLSVGILILSRYSSNECVPPLGAAHGLVSETCTVLPP